MTFDFSLFKMLREFFACADSFFEADEAPSIYPGHPLLKKYLEQTNAAEALQEIRENAASEKTFTARFFRHFNMLWILKFLHWAEDHGVGKVEVGKAARELLALKDPGSDFDSLTGKDLLDRFRRMERGVG